VDDSDLVSVSAQQQAPPPLVLMSLSLVTLASKNNEVQMSKLNSFATLQCKQYLAQLAKLLIVT
jgi:hypothetical protein